ncbi:MAG: hypothetical protein IPK82_20160 [Polyangiaceae bacterium]|nr:hypothetical protein [Polyangiaceae bacterium]
MVQAVRLEGWEDLSNEVQTTFGEIGEAIGNKPFAVRPVARRILQWDGRKLPADGRRIVVGLKEAARTLIRFDTLYKAQLKTAPTIYLVGSFGTIEPGKNSGVMVFKGPYSNAPWVLRGAVWSPLLSEHIRVPKFEVAGIDIVLAKATIEGEGKLAEVQGADPAIFAHDGMDKHFVAPWVGQVFTPETTVKVQVHNFTDKPLQIPGVTLKVQASPCDQTWAGVIGPFKKRLAGLNRLIRPFGRAGALR